MLGDVHQLNNSLEREKSEKGVKMELYIESVEEEENLNSSCYVSTKELLSCLLNEGITAGGKNTI